MKIKLSESVIVNGEVFPVASQIEIEKLLGEDLIKRNLAEEIKEKELDSSKSNLKK